ncbi:hypothetical protein SSX86_002411 [Deinandra increscens subsp. villosa]|uniref:RNase III domain-containing protein n=1 Tax=Deinandra increscens subsp. villosa TaxID=3103831 RepID=A0AAP0DWC7_9ASTR
MAAAVTALHALSVKVRASWDTQQRPSYNPQHRNSISVSALLTRKSPSPNQVCSEEMYLGYETWMPSAPKVDKPRSTYNAASLAYIGDCIYELYARRHFLFPPLNIEEYNDRVMAVVRCEAQA